VETLSKRDIDSPNRPDPKRGSAIQQLLKELLAPAREQVAVLTRKGAESLTRYETEELQKAWLKIEAKISSLELDHVTPHELKAPFDRFCVSAAHRRTSFERLVKIASFVAVLLAAAPTLGLLILTMQPGRPHALAAYLLTALALAIPGAWALKSRRPLRIGAVGGLSLLVCYLAWRASGDGPPSAITALLRDEQTDQHRAAVGMALGAALVAALMMMGLSLAAVMRVIANNHPGLSAPDVKAFGELHAVIIGLLSREDWKSRPAHRRAIAERLEDAAQAVGTLYRPYSSSKRRVRQQRRELRSQAAQAAKVLRSGRPLTGGQAADDQIVADCIASMIAICLGDHSRLPSIAAPPPRPWRGRGRRVLSVIGALAPMTALWVALKIGIPMDATGATIIGTLCVGIAVVGLFLELHPNPGQVVSLIRRLLPAALGDKGEPARDEPDRAARTDPSRPADSPTKDARRALAQPAPPAGPPRPRSRPAATPHTTTGPDAPANLEETS
jgi:hypothetical protein